MGTFILRPVTVGVYTPDLECTINGGFVSPPPTDQQLVDAVQGVWPDYFVACPTVAPTNPSVTYSCLGLGLYLDGSLTPIDTNNLPPGFAVTSASAKAQLYVPLGSVCSVSLTRNASTIATQSTPTASPVDVDIDLGVLSNLGLITSILGFSFADDVSSQAAGSDLRIEGIYQSGSFVITPGGGNIEPGQTITVEGPNAAEMEYAATNGDKVIPLDPKVVDPDTVILEVPNPSPDPCMDCLGDCTECEDCFDACNEDLTSQACQDCMAACLECLEGCLESLESAEECQESKQDPPGTPTNIVIICGGPGFDGSVPLGTFTIIVANGSGIYEFVEGKSNDTLYSAARDGSTYDVRIPNPGGKTGFFRS